MSNGACSHLDQIAVRELPPSVDGCEDCLRTGGKWLHLRICLTCGHVACCDDSPNRHATAHAHATSHPIIRSLEPGEDWNWCYVDEVAFLVDGIRGKTESHRRRSCSNSARRAAESCCCNGANRVA